jgi:hypothetical protein
MSCAPLAKRSVKGQYSVRFADPALLAATDLGRMETWVLTPMASLIVIMS